ncbi:MAG: ABC transporter substrate-binding protein [Betaproteobacteria bacterium]|nr:MAG: ABC transporter substrate-binding protein [Betaproteobacteria bacterium]
MSKALRKTRVELNNAVFSLPDLVAKSEGYFEQEGLDVELVLPEKRKTMLATAGSREVEPAAVRSLLWHEGIETGEFSVYHACIWGQMRRTQDACTETKVITKRAAVSTQAIVVRGDAPWNVPQDLANVEVAVNFHAGSHYITLGMLSGFMKREEVKTIHVGIPNQRFKALMDGSIQAAAVMEPWISAAEKLGCKVICEAFYNGLEVADPTVDAEVFSALHRAQVKAVDTINRDIRPWLRHLTDEVPADIVKLEPADLHLPRLRYNYPQPYSPAEFGRIHDFMVDWGLISPQSTYDKLVDSRLAV